MIDGTFTSTWKPTKVEAPEFRCRACQSDDVWYRMWESSDGGYTDLQYQCYGCRRMWWVEGPDA